MTEPDIFASFCTCRDLSRSYLSREHSRPTLFAASLISQVCTICGIRGATVPAVINTAGDKRTRGTLRLTRMG